MRPMAEWPGPAAYWKGPSPYQGDFGTAESKITPVA